MPSAASQLTPEKALIWRITHRDNVDWILEHGLQCPKAPARCPDWVSIGNNDVIDKRARRAVPVGPGGFLHDYVPFYFTPFSPMLYNIKTGYAGIRQRRNEEIVMLVARLRDLADAGKSFVFTDRMALLQTAVFYDRLDELHRVDWPLIQSRDFSKNPDDPGKIERYMAEALVHRALPASALAGVVCNDTVTRDHVNACAAARSLSINVQMLPGWYF